MTPRAPRLPDALPLARHVARRLALAAVVAVLVQAIWAIWSYHRTDELRELEEDAVEWVLDALIARVQPDGTVGRFQPRRYDFGAVRYAVVDLDGRRLDGTLTVDPLLQARAAVVHELFFADERADGNRWFGARRASGRNGRGFVVFAEVQFPPQNYPLHILVAEVLETAVFPTLPVIVLMYGVGVLAIRGSLGGVRRAAREARRLDPQRRGGRLSEENLPAEILSLVRAVNGGIGALEAQLAEQQAFAGEVAHELRTPLAIMTLELDRLGGPVAERLRADVAAMSHRIDQLLASARAGALRLADTDRANLAEIAAEVVGRYAPVAVGHGVSLELDGGDAVPGPVTVLGDATAIAAALLNIVENAVHVSPRGGTVQVAAGPGPTLTVSDQGPGIAPAVREQLFEPYRRGDARGPGAGLGLSIVRRTMEAHGGSIDIQSPPEGGARVVLRFRAAV